MKNELKKLNYKNFIMLTIAGFINAFGITVFLMPVNLYDSGISGTSMLLGYLTPDYLSLSIFLLVLNLPLFLYGLKRRGKRPSGTFRRSYGRYRGAGGNIFEKTRHDCRHVRYDLQRDTLHSLRIHI